MPIKKKNEQSNSLLSLIWPVEPGETIKCISLVLLIFFISFNYTILKALKDPLIITAQNSSALVLAFLKTWAVLPAALIGASTFTWLCNKFGFKKTFNILVSFFLVYFLLFVFYLYPYRESLYLGNPESLVLQASSSDWLNFSNFLRTLLTLVYYWPLSTFYVIAELWSSIVLSVLFWGFANQITPLYQAKRFYGIINLLGNISGFIAGMTSYYFNSLSRDNIFFDNCCAWDHTLYGLLTLIISFSIISLFVFHFAYNRFYPEDLDVIQEEQTSKTKEKSKNKMGIMEAFSKCFQSKYIFSIAMIVLAYNLSMNILEILWKDQTRILYPKTADYHNYMSQVTMLTGVFSTFFGLLISTIIRYFAWKKTAYFTPFIISITSFLFFGALFFNNADSSYLPQMATGLTPLAIVVLVGGLQNSLCRSAKFTFFDTTKEIAFIPLSRDEKIKAKAVIDGIGSRLGKSAGAVFVQIMILFIPTVSAMAPYFLAVLLPILSTWFWAIRYIGSVFSKYEEGKGFDS